MVNSEETPPNSDESRLRVLDATMQVHATTSVSGFATLVADSEYIYTASEAGFFIYDTDLNTVSEVALREELDGNHMEDIYLHVGTAYIVDNVVEPKCFQCMELDSPWNCNGSMPTQTNGRCSR